MDNLNSFKIDQNEKSKKEPEKYEVIAENSDFQFGNSEKYAKIKSNLTENEKFSVIVLSGGAIKGIYELGALYFYFVIGKFDQKKSIHYYGTSIGAAIAFLLALGMSAFDILHKIYNFTTFIEPTINLLKILSTYGLFKIETFIEKVKNIANDYLKEKYTNQINPCNCESLTFLDLRLLTKNSLTMNATNISKMKKEIYNCEITPNMNILEALSHSCNLPIFCEKIFNESNIHSTGGYFVDGGLSSYCLIDEAYNNHPKEQILCICIDFDLNISSVVALDIKEYLYRIIMYPIKAEIEKIRKTYMEDSYVTLIMISSKEVFFQLTINSTKKMDYFIEGYNIAENFIFQKEKI